ncbi:MAG: EAL domain-containing protein [Gammaproteobacteria bacterium]|nr:EAL domain-containing protein [Gammaproteobacteria bacterium]NIM74421.1 EAL domain-containing protein [Gammaproteobacteria bacterium]NIO26192.1 EAL domain-containing protein [Gammaproteobacteria bacterium]NIO66806.1 EAL domain-containing protein [Gammaproteobacteria bacterium]NIP46112.1 EAL domain-containing protein [Gammaproteobacteria bacterium]
MHQESSLRSRKSLPTGHQLLSYRIESVLGAGGFGITYLATDTNLNRAVAIKEYFPEQLASRDDEGNIHATSEKESSAFVWGRERFLKEGQILARFSNPYIVSVLDFFELHNTSYMVMEYESGESLKSIIREGRRLSEGDVLEILLPLLRSLARFHNEGFIHRDIKPANILIRRDGTPVLLDFGSARQTVSGERLSLTSLVSPGYAPVEQYSDKGAHQGPWTDIYALGATFYHLLTGRMPATAMERTASLHDGSDPLTPASVLARGAYSEELLKAIDISMKLMEHERPRSVSELLELLPGGGSTVGTVTETGNTTRAVSPSTTRQVTPAYARSRIIDRHAATEINPEVDQSNTATAPTTATLSSNAERSSLYSQISAQMMGKRSKRLLIVDDDARVCRLVKRVSEGIGFHTYATDNPVDFPIAYQGFRPDVIVLDLQMGHSDGVELLRYLADQGAEEAIVLMSGVDQRIIDTAARLGKSLGLNIVNVLNKPIDINVLRTELGPLAEGTVTLGPGGPLHERDLERAILENQITVHYQPKIALKSGRVTGVEALVRWRQSSEDLIPPDRFIPLAEKTGLIDALTQRVLETALADARTWSDKWPELNLAVNLSPSMLSNLELPDRIASIVRSYDMDPGRLILEVTESGAMQRPDQTMEILARLRLKGVQLSIDDFGAGHSSLLQLYRLPFGELKIERSFVIDALDSQEAATIIHATIELGHRLGLKVVAEGVEDKLTAEWLAQLQCDIGQGNFFSVALPSPEFLAWMDHWAGNQSAESTPRRGDQSPGSDAVVSLSA